MPLEKMICGDNYTTQLLKDNVNSLIDIIGSDISPNIVDESLVQEDAGITNEGVIVYGGQTNGWGLLILPIDSDTEYTIKNAQDLYAINTVGAIGFIDGNDVIQSFSQINSYPTALGGGRKFTTPTGATSIAVNLYVGITNYDGRGNLQIEKGGAFTGYEPFGIRVSPTKSNIEGKKIVTIGDSMVKGHSLSSGQVWDSLIAERNNMTLVNYGINGGELVENNSFGDSVLNRYSLMDDDADYVVVFAGTNDANANKALGSDSDSVSAGQDTFKGGLNDLCDGLISKYPDKKILFITPYNRNSNYPAYINAISERCAAHSIPVFNNQIEGGVLWTNTAQVDSLTLGDTYHLNESGMRYVSTKYEAKLNSL